MTGPDSQFNEGVRKTVKLGTTGGSWQLTEEKMGRNTGLGESIWICGVASRGGVQLSEIRV